MDAAGEELEAIRDGREVIGGLEYNPELDHFVVWSIHHVGYSPRLMYDHDEAVRWVEEIHAEYARQAERKGKLRAP